MAVVMFDYDGVIVDSFAMHVQNFIEACRENGFKGIKNKDDLLELYNGNVYQGMLEQGLTREAIDQILAAYQYKQNAYLDGIKLFEGMAEALGNIARYHPIYIITSNVSQAPVTVLARHHVNCYQEVLGAEKEKSKIKKIKMTMEKHQGLPAFYVGDTVGDILEGRAAGAATIGVAWGWHGAAKLDKSNPDFIASTPQSLSAYLCKESF